MLTNIISLYRKINDIESAETISLDIFLDFIRDGHWQDIVLPIRAIADDKEREIAKRKLVPSVTIAGKFRRRLDNELEKHSGYMAIDLDDLANPEKLKTLLSNDKYVVAAFKSVSGRGLCVLFKIAPDKHRQSYRGAAEYFHRIYGQIVDPTGINPSRARFVSFDPHIYQNESAEKFAEYPKEKEYKETDKFIHTVDDFNEILKQIVENKTNITQDSYYVWYRIAFALVHKFGEQGRQFFHLISQYSSKYEQPNGITDRQYDACLKHRTSAEKEVTISTFYFYAKQAGINIYSERTKLIIHSTSQSKKAGLNKADIANNLENLEGITNAEDIISQAYDNAVEVSDDSLISQLEIWMRQRYKFRRNLVTRYIESDGANVEQTDLNSIFIAAKKIFPKLTYELIDRLIHSNFIPSYNPFHEYFAEPAQFEPGQIRTLANTIETKDNEYFYHFLLRWMVGAVSSVYGKHSPLMLVLSGDVQNTGKTEWFRRLLPSQLKKYYAESKLDAGKDDYILMTQKFILMDDEMGGKSKKEVKLLKELTSKQTFSLREPYGRNNIDLQRIATLCGTTNDNEILSDPTGNRRIIPIHVNSINFALYNSIDKAQLWAEAYQLYKDGFEWQLTREDIAYLNTDAISFELTVTESELISKYFEAGQTPLMASEIKVMIEAKTGQKLSVYTIARELKRSGFIQKMSWRNGVARRCYLVNELTSSGLISDEAAPAEDLPF